MNKEFKTYKEFLNESKEFDQSRFPLEDPEEVKEWINKNVIGQISNDKIRRFQDSIQWNVDDEGYFSTPGSLWLHRMELTKLPFKIKSIGKNLSISENNLTDLKGLENLEFIGDYFMASGNQLTTLENLKNLKYVGGSFGCYDNKLTMLKGLESLKYVGSNFGCYDNKLLSKKIPFEVKGTIYFKGDLPSSSPYNYEDSVKHLVSLSEEEQKKIIEDLESWDPEAYQMLKDYSWKKRLTFSGLHTEEELEWRKKAEILDDTGLEF